MTISIGIFGASLIGIAAFFAGKLLEIRTKRRLFVSFVGDIIETVARKIAILIYPPYLKFRKSIGRERLIFYIRFLLSVVHNFFRSVVNSSEEFLIGWTDVVRGKRMIRSKGSASFFLRDIAEHKSQLPKNR